MQFVYEMIRSNRKTVSLQMKPDGKIVVRCPLRMPQQEVDAFVNSKADWLEKHLEKLSQIAATPAFSVDEIRQMADAALNVIPERVAWYAKRIGVTYGRITVRNQRTRWGSCSGQGNLNFNCLLVLTPPEVMDYVIVHELCHRIEMNHSKDFWSLVGKYIPEYKIHRKWLKDHGAELIKRLYF